MIDAVTLAPTRPDGHLSGKRLYMKLVRSDSHDLTRRHRDDTEVSPLKNHGWATDWHHRDDPITPLSRSSDGQIQWMDVSTT